MHKVIFLCKIYMIKVIFLYTEEICSRYCFVCFEGLKMRAPPVARDQGFVLCVYVLVGMRRLCKSFVIEPTALIFARVCTGCV